MILWDSYRGASRNTVILIIKLSSFSNVTRMVLNLVNISVMHFSVEVTQFTLPVRVHKHR